MTRCSIINCTNSSNKGEAGKKGISFHCFPNDPHIKNKWIEATGRKKWFPTPSSRICSVHFHEEDFTAPSKNRRIISTAYPTIDIVMAMSNDEQIKSLSTSEEESKNNTAWKRKLEVDPLASDETPIHIPKKKNVMRKLNNMKQIIIQKDKKIKCLKEQNRRKQIKINKLMELLVSLKKKTLISDDTSGNLKNKSND